MQHMYAAWRAHPNEKPEIHFIEKDIQSGASVRRQRHSHFSVSYFVVLLFFAGSNAVDDRIAAATNGQCIGRARRVQFRK